MRTVLRKNFWGGPLNSSTDGFQALLDRITHGSEEAAWELVERYGSHIRAVVRRRMHPSMRRLVDSDDFVQSVWGSLVRIGPRLGASDGPEPMVALLATMAQNKVIDAVRQRTMTTKHRMVTQGLDGSLVGAKSLSGGDPQGTASQVAIARERWNRMLAEEPPLSKQMLELRLAGGTYTEIAQQLGINEKTVRRTIARLLEREAAERN